MKILSKEQLSQNKYKTAEGYLICLNSILARTGKQVYLESELKPEGDNTKEIEVIRLKEEVLNDKTIASFENKPVTIEHPANFVNVENFKEYSVGFVRNVRANEEDELLIGDIVITDQKAINLIEAGKNYLSCGYLCDILEDTTGQLFQRNIRGNHIAICDNPRAGITRILDSKEQALEDKERIEMFKKKTKDTSEKELLIKEIEEKQKLLAELEAKEKEEEEAKKTEDEEKELVIFEEDEIEKIKKLLEHPNFDKLFELLDRATETETEETKEAETEDEEVKEEEKLIKTKDSLSVLNNEITKAVIEANNIDENENIKLSVWKNRGAK